MGIFSPNNTTQNTLDNKIRDYMQYINDHIANVKKAYNDYGSKLLELLPDVKEEDLLKAVKGHDDSKTSNYEFDAYRNKFFPCEGEECDENEFKIACLRHYHKNPHHWNYWVMVDENGVNALDMPDLYILEMILDWISMGYKYNSNPLQWYKDKDRYKKLILSDLTRSKVETILNTLWG